MISFTFILIFFILGSVCVIFFIAAVLKFFEFLYPRASYFQRQNQTHQVESKKYARITEGNQPEEKIKYSLIYTIHRQASQHVERFSIKKQLEALSELMTENIKDESKYEIVCVIDPSDYYIFHYISSLYQDHRYITPVLKSTKGLEYFINGFISSKGSIIIDSAFLPSNITSLTEIDESKLFVEFIEPKTEKYSFLNKSEHFIAPILMTRLAGEKIIGNLHLTKNGASNEILYLCRYFNIETQIQHQKIGRTNISAIDLFVSIMNERIGQMLYLQKYWQIK